MHVHKMALLTPRGGIPVLLLPIKKVSLDSLLCFNRKNRYLIVLWIGLAAASLVLGYLLSSWGCGPYQIQPSSSSQNVEALQDSWEHRCLYFPPSLRLIKYSITLIVKVLSQVKAGAILWLQLLSWNLISHNGAGDPPALILS